MYVSSVACHRVCGAISRFTADGGRALRAGERVGYQRVGLVRWSSSSSSNADLLSGYGGEAGSWFSGADAAASKVGSMSSPSL